MFAFISAERSVDSAGVKVESATNTVRTRALKNALKNHGFNFEETSGVYDGVEEESFKINLRKGVKELSLLRQIAYTFSQDCILFVNDHYKSILVSVDQLKPIEKEAIGTYKVSDFPVTGDHTKLSNGKYAYIA